MKLLDCLVYAIPSDNLPQNQQLPVETGILGLPGGVHATDVLRHAGHQAHVFVAFCGVAQGFQQLCGQGGRDGM